MMSPLMFLKWFLRSVGSVSLLALAAVFLPYSAMNSIHQGLGLGSLSEQPIVGYLARSTSAFYAFYGGLLWLVSGDLPRFRPVVVYLGCVTLLLGLILLGVDWHEGLPPFWKFVEGPMVMFLGAVMLWGSRKIPSRDVFAKS